MGLEDILASPLLQSALAGYLGYVGSPRIGGTGRALSSGGLNALQAFQGAREQQAMLPYRQAMVQEAQARVPYMQAQTKSLTQESDLAGKMQTQRETMARRIETEPQFGKLGMNRAIIAQGIREGHIQPEMPGLTQYQTEEIGLQKKQAAAQEKHYGAEEAHYQEQERLAGMPGGSDIQQYLDPEGQLRVVNVKAGERPEPTWRPYEKKDQLWTDETGKSFVSLPVGVVAPAGYKPYVKPSGATLRPTFKTYIDPATKETHTLDVAKETPDPKWVPYSTGSGKAQWKSYIDPATSEVHTINATVTEPDPSWAPYTKPESEGTVLKKGADTLAKYRKDFENGLNLIKKHFYSESEFTDYLQNIGVDPTTGQPLKPASAKTPSASPAPASAATVPAVASTPAAKADEMIKKWTTGADAR